MDLFRRLVVRRNEMLIKNRILLKLTRCRLPVDVTSLTALEAEKEVAADGSGFQLVLAGRTCFYGQGVCGLGFVLGLADVAGSNT